MSAALKMIHVAKRELRMEDVDYRDLLMRRAGQATAKGLSDTQMQDVLTEMKRLGFKPTGGGAGMDGPYAGKLRALWLSAHNLGIARNPKDAALIAFVERQTGIGQVRWLRNAWDAERAIEALKKWITREAGVVWPSDGDPLKTKLAVINAQRRKLGAPEVTLELALGIDPDSVNLPDPRKSLDDIIAEQGERIRTAA